MSWSSVFFSATSSLSYPVPALPLNCSAHGVVVRLQPQIGGHAPVGTGETVDLVAAKTAVAANHTVALEQLRCGRVGKSFAGLQVDHAMVTFQTQALGKPAGIHRDSPSADCRTSRTRLSTGDAIRDRSACGSSIQTPSHSPALRGTPCSQTLFMGCGLCAPDKQVQTRVSGIGMRQTASNRQANWRPRPAVGFHGSPVTVRSGTDELCPSPRHVAVRHAAPA